MFLVSLLVIFCHGQHIYFLLTCFGKSCLAEEFFLFRKHLPWDWVNVEGSCSISGKKAFMRTAVCSLHIVTSSRCPSKAAPARGGWAPEGLACVQGQVGWGPGQPGLAYDLVVGSPDCGRGIGTRSLKSPPTQAILWFYGSLQWNRELFWGRGWRRDHLRVRCGL